MAIFRTRNPRRPAMVRARRCVMGLVLVSVVTVLAHAAGLPLSAANLGAWMQTGGSGSPTVYGFDNFDGADANLNGTQLVTGGGTWVANLGAWSTLSNQARQTSTLNNSNITVNIGQTQVDLQAQLIPTTAKAGLDLNDDGANRMMALYTTNNGGRIDLETYFGATRTVVATINNTGVPAAGASLLLRVWTQGNQVLVYKDGVLRITHTLTAAQQAAVRDADNTKFGLWADRANAARFDNFRAQSP